MGIEVVGSNQSYQPVQSYQPAPVESATVIKTGSDTLTNIAVKASNSVSEGQVKGDNGKQPSEEEVKSAIEQANKRARGYFGHANAEFSYHEATKRISVKIIDQDTNEVIREIPPEETLDMISKMWELAGIIVDEKR